jgi:hypothetical protein
MHFFSARNFAADLHPPEKGRLFRFCLREQCDGRPREFTVGRLHCRILQYLVESFRAVILAGPDIPPGFAGHLLSPETLENRLLKKIFEGQEISRGYICQETIQFQWAESLPLFFRSFQCFSASSCYSLEEHS